jgi:hypothetical protein
MRPDFEMDVCAACAWLAVAILVMAFLTGCAWDRYLTEEQDAAMRVNCEQHGCKVVPSPLWRQIEEVLRMLAPRREGTREG